MPKFTLTEEDKTKMREIAEAYLKEYKPDGKKWGNGELGLFSTMLDVRPDIQKEADRRQKKSS